jgi:hypothetical protein
MLRDTVATDWRFELFHGEVSILACGNEFSILSPPSLGPQYITTRKIQEKATKSNLSPGPLGGTSVAPLRRRLYIGSTRFARFRGLLHRIPFAHHKSSEPFSMRRTEGLFCGEVTVLQLQAPPDSPDTV